MAFFVHSLDDWTNDLEDQNTAAAAGPNDMYRGNIPGASGTTAFDNSVVNPSSSTAVGGSKDLYGNNIFNASDDTDSGGMFQ